MSLESNINNIDLGDYKDSYTLRCAIEGVHSEFYNGDAEIKENLLRRLDKEISEKLKMPEANFVFEDNELTLDDKNIYFGKLSSIKSPYELLGRYLFEKRQQYQRICINSNDKGSFSDVEFNDLKAVYDVRPVSKKNMYTPYSMGLEEYLLNYNKVDALFYMFNNVIKLEKMIDLEKMLINIGRENSKRMTKALEKFQRDTSVILNAMQTITENESYGTLLQQKMVDFKIKKNAEKYILSAMVCNLHLLEPRQNYDVLLLFNENVWENIEEDNKKACVEACNEFMASFMDVMAKNVVYDKGLNSYNFADNENVYVGKLNEVSPYSVLLRLLNEYTFDRMHEDIKNSENESKIRAYEKCKKMYLERNSYEDIKNFVFIKKFRKRVLHVLGRMYDYMNDCLWIEGEKLSMPISKENFVIDMFNTKKRR